MDNEENFRAVKEGIKEAFREALQNEFDLRGRGWIAEAIKEGIKESAEESSDK